MKNEKECKAARPRLQRFADGELPAEEARELRSHLMDCLGCRAIAGETYAVRKFFQDDEPVAIPAGFSARVAALAFSGPAADRDETEALPFVRILAALAAGILLVAGSFLLVRAGIVRGGGIEVHAGTQLDREIEEMDRARAIEARKAPPKTPAAPAPAAPKKQ